MDIDTQASSLEGADVLRDHVVNPNLKQAVNLGMLLCCRFSFGIAGCLFQVDDHVKQIPVLNQAVSMEID